MNDRDKLQRAELRILELEAEVRRRDEHHVCPRIPNPGEYAQELVKMIEAHAYPQRIVLGANDGTSFRQDWVLGIGAVHEAVEATSDGGWLAVAGVRIARKGDQYRVTEGEHAGRIGFVTDWPRDSAGAVTTLMGDQDDPIIPVQIYGKSYEYPLSSLVKIELRRVTDSPQA